MIVTGSGVAGSLEGKLAVGVSDLEAGGTLVLRFNNTGSAVNEELSVGEKSVSLSFSDSEKSLFSVSLLGGSVEIGDVVTIEGDVTFTSQGDYKVFGGENMTLFVGDGPLNKDGKRNPDARGLMISDATIGLVKDVKGDDVKYALKAEGQVSVMGCLLYTSPSPRD